MRDHSVPVWFTAVVFLILSFFHVPAFSATIAHWKLNGSPGTVATGTGTILDSSGNNLHGTPFGGPIYASVGLDFDGINDSVDVPDDIKFQLTGSLTIEAFITARNATPYGIILGRFDDRIM